MAAIWIPVVGFEGFYEVSNEGFVRSVRTGRVLSPGLHKQGYRLVTLCKSGTRSTKTVHRIVAIAFIPNPDRKPFVDHIYGVAAGDMVKNLRWATRTENCQNAGIRSDNKTGHKGVTFNQRSQKYEARIKLNGKVKYLGSFITAEEAYAAYCAAAQTNYGVFARLV